MPELPAHRQSSYISRQSVRGSLYEEIPLKGKNIHKNHCWFQNDYKMSIKNGKFGTTKDN